MINHPNCRTIIMCIFVAAVDRRGSGEPLVGQALMSPQIVNTIKLIEWNIGAG
ncbi:hypothetical protein Syun_027353 [Stephania yunnanensis]|uniref:Uncharacterized protein n=1 Tax=Stephania yunnanensis TaxID=152371 RepID=A0AAP0HPW4_9MAGN